MSNYKVPNMGSIATFGKTTNSTDCMARIVRNMNESVGTPEPAPADPEQQSTVTSENPVNESLKECTCPRCGMKFTFDTSAEDGSHPFCPACNFEVTDQAYSNTLVDEEQTIQESLETTLDEYMTLLEFEQYDDAKKLLESEEATAVSDEEGIMLEKVKIVVHADGTKEKKKIKTKKKKLKGKKLAAARKNAKKMAKNGAAKRKRAKAMKARRKKVKNEMLQTYQITESIMNILTTNGIDTVDRSAVTRLIKENQERVNESVMDTTDQMISTIQTVLNNRGIEVLDTDVEVGEDGVVAVEVLVQDTEAEIYLGEVSDEIAETCDCAVEYDDPDPDEDDESVVDLTFYLIPNSQLEESAKNEGEGCDPEDPEVDEGCGGKKKKNECDDPDKKNESVTMVGGMTLNESFNAYAGGQQNVRCQLNPAFIRPGQIIYDADQKTIFKALTESVHQGEEYGLTVDVLNSVDQSLAGVLGAKVSITADGNYYLLKSNPME